MESSPVRFDSVSSETNWMDLPIDISESILDKLTLLPDYIRFGAVCKQWFRIAQNQKQMRAKSCQGQPPMLMILTKGNKERRNMYSPCEDRVYNCQLPIPCSLRCTGSSYGWWAFAEKDLSITLVNPFHHGKTIHLPPIMKSPSGTFRPEYIIRKVILSCDPCLYPNDYVVAATYGGFTARVAFIRPDDRYWNRPEHEKYFHYVTDLQFHSGKLYAIDSGNQLVVVNYSYDEDDEEDDDVEDEDHSVVVDNSSGRSSDDNDDEDEDEEEDDGLENKDYSVDVDNSSGNLDDDDEDYEEDDSIEDEDHSVAVDNSSNYLDDDDHDNGEDNGEVEEDNNIVAAHNFCDNSAPDVDHNGAPNIVYFCPASMKYLIKRDYITVPYVEWSRVSYLVESLEGELLLVRRIYFMPDAESDYDFYSTASFKVYKLTRKQKHSNGKKEEFDWVEIQSLGNSTLFLGRNHSMCILATGFPNCKPNCIYYTDANAQRKGDPDEALDMGVFHLENGQIEKHYDLPQTLRNMPAPVWICPTLLPS